MTTFHVNVDYDTDLIDDDNTIVTLREAVVRANQFPGTDTISFASGLNGATTTLGRDEFGNDLGLSLLDAELNITEGLEINASTLSGGLTIQAYDPTPTQDNFDGALMFDIRSTALDEQFVFQGLTLTGADTFSTAGVIAFNPGYYSGSVRIQDCVITGNRSTNNSAIQVGNGGSLEVAAGSEITNNFSSNSAGGISFSAGLSDASVEISNCTLSGNVSQQSNGGAISASGSNAELTITNSVISGNSASTGGGVYLGSPKSATISDSQFLNNTASINGGGLGFVMDARLSDVQTITVERSRFEGNRALTTDEDLGGGGIFANLSAHNLGTPPFPPVFNVVDSTVTGNTSLGSGGGIWVCSKFGGEFNLSSTTVDHNTAGQEGYEGEFGPIAPTGHGGGIWLAISEIAMAHSPFNADLVNATVSGNTAFSRGGGVWVGLVEEGTDLGELNASLRHTTITDNNSPEGGGLFSDPDGTNQRITTTLSNTIVSGNRVAESIASDPNNVAGTIDSTSDYNLFGTSSPAPVLPILHNIFTDDPRLGPLMDNGGLTKTHAPDCTSDALDAGDPNAMAGVGDVPLVDQRGFNRVFDQLGIPNANGGNSIIDIGAYELSLADLPALAADFNGDMVVDSGDFLIWQQNFGLSGAEQSDGDANGDHIVNVTDLTVWSEQYGDDGADFNNDSVVDGGDLAIWQANFGMSSGATFGEGDANGDHAIDGSDFLVWQVRFSQSIDCHQWAAYSLALAELEPGEIYVSTTRDEDDGDYSLGDLSLREAVKMANAMQTPATIVLPAGHYLLSLTGTENYDASFNDLDITGDVTIVGAGAGATVIDNSALTGSQGRIFNVSTSGASLEVSSVTMTSGTAHSYLNGMAVNVASAAAFVLTDSAVVNHDALGAAIAGDSADVTIRRSVFTNNQSDYNVGPAVRVVTWSGGSASLTIGESVFALNQGAVTMGSGGFTWSVEVDSNVALTNEGQNLIDTTYGGFFDTTPGVGDYLGTPDYVVTSIADTFDHTDNDDALSIREAVDLANQASGQSEVWLPAWDFVLTRARDYSTQLTDTDVAFGDIDIKESILLRGVTGLTSVDWFDEVPTFNGHHDKVFDLLGSAGDGAVPIIIMVQNDEGRIALNDTLTHEGVLDALNSKNVILNSFIVRKASEAGGVHTAGRLRHAR